MSRLLVFGVLLTLSAFVSAQSPTKDGRGVPDWSMVFDSYDFDNDGRLNVHEFQQFLLTIYNKVPGSKTYRHQLAKLAQLLDFDGDGMISQEEFRKIYDRYYPIVNNPRICYRLVVSDELIQQSSAGELYFNSRAYALNSLNATMKDFTFGNLAEVYVGPCNQAETFTYQDDIMTILSLQYQNIHFKAFDPKELEDSCSIIVHSQMCGAGFDTAEHRANVLVVNDPSDRGNTFDDYSTMIYNRQWSQKLAETRKLIVKIALFYARQFHEKYFSAFLKDNNML